MHGLSRTPPGGTPLGATTCDSEPMLVHVVDVAIELHRCPRPPFVELLGIFNRIDFRPERRKTTSPCEARMVK